MRIDMASAPKVLIVDDDAGSVDTFEFILKAHGFTVCVAADAESGFREIERSSPTVLLLDLHLPTLDGVEFLRRLRSTRRYAGIQVAIVTGDYLLDQRIPEQIADLGARLFFKPLWEDDLIRLVRDLLRHSGSPASYLSSRCPTAIQSVGERASRAT